MLHVVLVEPEIPQNTGNIARTCLAAGARLHLVEPLGFEIDGAALRRAGMDYWEQCDVRRWRSLEALRAEAGAGRFFYLTTKATRPYWDAMFADGDYLVFGTYFFLNFLGFVKKVQTTINAKILLALSYFSCNK